MAASPPSAAASTVRRIVYEHELDDSFTGLQVGTGGAGGGGRAARWISVGQERHWAA